MDSILGDDNITVEHLPKLKYIDAVLKESLRLHPPAAQIGMGPVGHDGILADKYSYSANDTMIINLVDLHKDPKVWGPDAAAFRPERMLDGGFERLPPNSWKPFGNGVRSCIGKDFAMQEAIMTMALILQRFEIRKADPAAQLIVEQTVTQKPVNFFMKIKRRPGKGLFVGVGGDTEKVKPLRQKPIPKPLTGPVFSANPLGLRQQTADKSLAIFYGSNAGTCKMFAEVLARHAASLGLIPSEIRVLDSATDNLPRDMPMVIITASYEGKPTDDSKAFVLWLENLRGNDGTLAGVRYSVFGIGNSDWASSYHRVPIAIDFMLAALGAERFAPLGLANVAEDVHGDYEDWAEGVWKACPSMETLNSPPFELQVLSQDRLKVEQEMVEVVVRETREISSNELGFAKMHTELNLPANMTYTPGRRGPLIFEYVFLTDCRRLPTGSSCQQSCHNTPGSCSLLAPRRCTGFTAQQHEVISCECISMTPRCISTHSRSPTNPTTSGLSSPTPSSSMPSSLVPNCLLSPPTPPHPLRALISPLFPPATSPPSLPPAPPSSMPWNPTQLAPSLLPHTSTCFLN